MKLILSLALSLFTLQGSSQSLERGLRAYYPFTGNANDHSGNKNNAVFNNATLTSDADGHPNSAYRFNGRNNYMRIPNSPSLNLKRQISLCVMVRPRGFYKGTCHGNSILMKGNYEGDEGNYVLRFDDAAYRSGDQCSYPVDVSHQTFYGNSNALPVYSPYIARNEWYSVVYTYDGSTVKLYVNCSLKRTTVVSGMRFTNAADLYFGGTVLPNYPYWFNGDLDEIRIYDRVLDKNEIEAYSKCIKELPQTDTIEKEELELISFDAIPADDNSFIRISWSARNEYNGSYIIRKNRKGFKDYYNIKTQPMRKKEDPNSYSFKDNNVIPGVVYEYEILFKEDKKLKKTKKISVSTKDR